MEAKSNSSFASSNNTNKDNKVRCIIGSNKEDKWIRISRWCINTSNTRLIIWKHRTSWNNRLILNNNNSFNNKDFRLNNNKSKTQPQFLSNLNLSSHKILSTKNMKITTYVISARKTNQISSFSRAAIRPSVMAVFWHWKCSEVNARSVMKKSRGCCSWQDKYERFLNLSAKLK